MVEAVNNKRSVGLPTPPGQPAGRRKQSRGKSLPSELEPHGHQQQGQAHEAQSGPSMMQQQGDQEETSDDGQIVPGIFQHGDGADEPMEVPQEPEPNPLQDIRRLEVDFSAR